MPNDDDERTTPTPGRVVTLPSQLAAALKSARIDAGLSQDALAARIGTTQRVVSNLENAPEGRTLATLFRALSGLGLELHVAPRPTDADPEDPDAW